MATEQCGTCNGLKTELVWDQAKGSVLVTCRGCNGSGVVTVVTK